MSTIKSIASNTISQIGAKFITAALSVIIVKLITARLGTAGYGQYTLIYEFLAIFLIIADFGFFTIAVKEMSSDDSRLTRILGNVLSIRVILMTLLALAAIALIYVGDYQPQIKFGVAVAAISMSINLVTITISAALQAKLKMNWNSFAIIIGKFTTLCYIYYTVTSLPDEKVLIHLIYAGLYGNLITLGITAAATMKITKIRMYADLQIWKELITKSVLYGFSLIAVTFYTRMTTLMLSHHHTASEVGIYQAPFRVFEILNLIPIVLLNCVLPVIMKNITNDKKVQTITQHTFNTLIIISFGIIVGINAIAEPIIHILFSSDFESSIPVLKLLSVAACCNALYILFSYLLLAFKKEKQLLIANIITLIATLPIAYVLTLKYAEIGAATTIILSQFIVATLSWIIGRPKLKLEIINKATYAGLFMALTIFALSKHIELNIYSSAIIGSIAYLLILVLNKGISPEIIDIIKKKDTNTISDHSNSKQKIAIDVRATIGQKAGKGWYVYNVLKELGQLDKTNEYFLYAKHDFYLPPNMPSNFHKRIIKGPLILWHLFAAIDMRINLRVNTLFAPASYIIPSLFIGKRVNVIPVIHDLVAIKYAKGHNKKAKIIEGFTLGRTLSRAKKIIAVSSCTKNDIIEQFSIPEEKITVIAEAARENYYLENIDKQIIEKEIERIRAKYSIPENFILFIGTLEPRKNITTIIKAFKRYQKTEQEKYPQGHPLNTKLVLIGKKGWNYQEIFQCITDLEIEKDIILPGYVDDADLPYILNAAHIFIYPSLYEGFGLPLLESYAALTPAISSNTPALKEVANDVSPMVEPTDIRELSKEIEKIMALPRIRKEIVKRQTEKLKHYSWQTTAKQILEMINTK